MYRKSLEEPFKLPSFAQFQVFVFLSWASVDGLTQQIVAKDLQDL